MKAYRTLPRTDEEHEKDMELLDFLQRKVDWCRKIKKYEEKLLYQRAADLYAELEETYSELESVKEDRDYYKQRCRDEGTY